MQPLIPAEKPPEEPDPPGPPDPRRVALIGFVIIVLLIVGGLLLTRVLRHMSRVQDCAMQGRTNCQPLDW